MAEREYYSDRLKEEFKDIRILILTDNKIVDYTKDLPRIHSSWKSFIEYYGFNKLIPNEEINTLYESIDKIRKAKENLRCEIIHLHSKDEEEPLSVTCKKVAKKAVSISFKKGEDKSSMKKGTEKQWLKRGKLPKSYVMIMDLSIDPITKKKNEVTYTDICKALKISRRACIYKVQHLVHEKYFSEEQIGRQKYFIITKAGQKKLIQ